MQIEMTIKGLMLDPVTTMPILILRDENGQRMLPIWIGPNEAQAIASQIENDAPQRPMTFYALIHLLVRGDPVTVDARPSDAIALALRTRAPIFVEESVIDNAKSVESTPDRADTERLQKWLESLDADDLGKYKM